MGYLSASDMAGQVDFETALHWHLSSNHYPPYPSKFIEAMTPVAKWAIERVAEGRGNDFIELPEGIEFRGRVSAAAFEIVESLHLEAFIGEE